MFSTTQMFCLLLVSIKFHGEIYGEEKRREKRYSDIVPMFFFYFLSSKINGLNTGKHINCKKKKRLVNEYLLLKKDF